ncbi:sensor histidine kinase [Marmoricola sp. RAF53]|uniref:sensor histidine kinase n=1 Tax=Marmoricola sp. RAF53 TaxID=3233059 RepID=UPI003F96CFCC
MGLLDRLRTTRLDAALAALFAVAGLVQTLFVPIAEPAPAILYVLGSTLPLAWRRTFPVESALVSAVFWLIPLDGYPVLGFLAVVLQFYALGNRGEPGRAVTLVTVGAAAASVLGTLLGPEAPVAAIGGALVVVAPVLAGRAVRHQQRQNQALVALTRELAEERSRAEEAAVGAERARIAQELHDVVGHEVTLIAIQAEAAAAALRTSPDRAAEPVEAIRTTAHRTLTEIRAVLGVLAPDGQATGPGTEDVAVVAERARKAGIANTLAVTGTPSPVQAPVSLAVNRIVRECLTNAGRHAPGHPVALEVDWTPEEVRIRAINPVTVRRGDRRRVVAGRGLTGIRHRAELLGGTFALATDDGCFDVRVSLPAGGGR